MGLEIGDTVTIRQWNDLVDEFGVDEFNDIGLPEGEYFVDLMMPWCGTEVVIKSIDYHIVKDEVVLLYYMEDDPDEWTFTVEMFEETK